MSIYSSIYIPRVSSFHNEEYIRHVMEFYSIGHVEYIDFTPINKKPGFYENVDEDFKAAFIHFKDYYSNNIWNTISAGESYKIQITENEYWLCLKNKNPIQRTMMNIHQVVENGRHLERLIEAQAKKIEELENKFQQQNHLEIIIENQSKKIAMLENNFKQIMIQQMDPKKKIYYEYYNLLKNVK